MAPGRNPLRSALFAVAVVGLSSAPLLMTAGCSSDGNEKDRKEWREEQRERKQERREDQQERKQEKRERQQEWQRQQRN